jgi:hypothetical protein
MFAKIKDDVLIKYPYGYDDLQEDNPHTRFTGVIDLVNLFKESEEHTLKGYDLVEIVVEDKPTTTPFPGLGDPMPLTPFHVVTLSDTPVKEGDKWMLKWNVEFVPPDTEV